MANKVLIIEDHPETSELLGNILQLEGIDFSIASDGKIGIERTRSEKPDLILLDVMMPEMSGFEVCNILKSDPETSYIPIIIVSARASDESVAKGKNLGANDYIPKPFDPFKLIELVKKHLKKIR
jgi:two-component system sensor histidine kinase/response regulator